MQLTQASSALGVRALIRDEEWIIRNADQCNLGCWQLSCIGVSEAVRTQPGGPAQRTIYYIDPFTQVDREADNRVAWAHFTKETVNG
ncbi:hypothetical protein D3C84_1191840 [compost metagenome]